MTKDLSYARSKNQNFLLAFSFVASSTPCSSAPTGPRLEASLHLSYCFKPKFTVSVGGQDPLPPPLAHPPEDPGAREGLGPCSPPLCSCPAWEKERAGGEGRPQPRIPSGSGHSPGPPLDCFLGLSRPLFRTKSPSRWEWIPAKELEKATLSTDPLWGPRLRPRTGRAGRSQHPGQALC